MRWRLRRALARLACALLFRVRLAGAANLPRRGPFILVANHPTYLDPLLVSLGSPRPVRFLAWSALFAVPLLGRAIRSLGAVSLDPARPGKEAWRRALALLERGEIVGVFPEGGRSRGAPLAELFPGAGRLARRAGCPLVPASIAGARACWPPGRRLPRPGGPILVTYHKPVLPPPGRGRAAAAAFLARAAAAIRAGAGEG